MAAAWRSVVHLHSRHLKKINVVQPVRSLNLLECQSKVLLAEGGMNVQRFTIVEDAKEADKLPSTFKANEYVVKAQILAGGRGLGHFDNGFKGGVHLTKEPQKVVSLVDQMLGHRLITKQTPKEGILVSKVMVAESVDIKRETYICFIMDRDQNGPVIIASPSGGTDIEEVAEKTPHLIKTIPVDIFTGVTRETANDLAKFLKFTGELQKQAADEIMKMWKLFLQIDAVQLEINPLVETDDKQVVSVDAKIQFDDNAAFRQKKIFAMEDFSETDEREIEAAKHNLNYISMEGNIGCLVNGAGLAMATMDIIQLHGGKPANFLDVGGGVGEDQVFHAFNILTSDRNVKAILVNVFGGIVNCSTIANGIVNASRNMKLDVPLVVRLEGTNVTEAREILSKSGLPVETAEDLEDAAKKVVGSLCREALGKSSLSYT